eukprot:TCONS_00072953-protein
MTENFDLNRSRLTTSSNVGSPGKFIFLLTNCNLEKASIPFGPQFGDQFVQAGDDVATCFSSFSKEFPLFSTANRSKLCISSNGYITVDQPKTSAKASLTSSYPVLVPFNYDMRSLGNNILYRTTKDQNILNLVDRDISLLKSVSSFKSKEAIVVTYNNVPYYEIRNILFRYQVVIATDYKNTYTIFNYDRIDRSGYHNIGFSEPSACNKSINVRFNLTKSNLTTNSNVDVPGKFVFLLTKCNKGKRITES